MKYLVQCNATIYVEVAVEAQDEDSAREKGAEAFHNLLDQATIPSPLELGNYEVWQVEEARV